MSIHTDPDRAHAVWPPSSAHRWIPCTASAEAIERLGEQEEGEAAAEGTEAHDEIERILGPLDGELVDPATMPIGQIDPDHPAAYGLALFVSYIRQLPPGRMWVEKRVALTKDIWGRADVQHWHEESGTLTIPDYKNGFVGVDAVKNPQLRIYAAGSIYAHKLPVRWIRYAIVQPNDFRPVPRVKQWGESADGLHTWASATAAIPNGPKTFVFGEHCRDCPLFGRCDPTKDVLTKFATAMATPADQVTPDQVAAFYACKKPIEHYFEALGKAEYKRAMAGKGSPGLKLVPGKANRDWIDEAAARAWIVKEKGIEALSPPTPAQAEKMGLKVDDMARAPEGKPTIAFADDPRAEWKPKSGVEMFKGVVPG